MNIINIFSSFKNILNYFFSVSKGSCLFPDFVQFFVYNLKYIYQHFKKKNEVSETNCFAPYDSPSNFRFFSVWDIYYYIFSSFKNILNIFFSCSNVVNFFLTHFSFLFTSQTIFTNTMKKKRISGKNYFAA